MLYRGADRRSFLNLLLELVCAALLQRSSAANTLPRKVHRAALLAWLGRVHWHAARLPRARRAQSERVLARHDVLVQLAGDVSTARWWRSLGRRFVAGGERWLVFPRSAPRLW